MNTKEVIEWLVEHHKELQYDKKGRVTNLVRTYNILDKNDEPTDLNLNYYRTLAIKQKKYKPYEKVETWMLGTHLKSKETELLFVIDAISIDNGVRFRGNSLFWDLDNIYNRFTYADDTPFGEEVV